MNLEEAERIARRHEDAYNSDFERYGDLYADDCVICRPVQGVTHDKSTMLALERRDGGLSRPEEHGPSRLRGRRRLAELRRTLGRHEHRRRREVRTRRDQGRGLRVFAVRSPRRQVRPNDRVGGAAADATGGMTQ